MNEKTCHIHGMADDIVKMLVLPKLTYRCGAVFKSERKVFSTNDAGTVGYAYAKE